MTIDVKPSVSLENWRDYFRRGDCDIFGIIDHAIMVAAADWPNEFKIRRGRIAELLFSCKLSHCIECDHSELAITGEEEEANHGSKTVETAGDGGGKEDEKKAFVEEVMRIKRILMNKEQSNVVVLEYLRRLESMSMSVDILKDTEIGKAVNTLRRHSSDKISNLAKTLFAEWKELVDQWMNIPKDIVGTEGTPESANLSVLDEEEAFPSPPHDLDFFAPEGNGFELSQILDCLDCDGNLRVSGESKHEKTLQSSGRRKIEGTNEANVAGRYNKDQQMRREEADVRPMKHSATDFDEPRRQPKQSREQMVPASQRKPLVVAEQKRKLAGSQQDKLKDLDPDTRFEFAKRKLQESYQQHENAKRQRTIQVLETIPKQSKAHKPQLKRSSRR